MDANKPQASIWDRIANNVAEAVQPQPPVRDLTPAEKAAARQGIESTFKK